MQRHTDVIDSRGQWLLTTIGIDTEAWDELYPSGHIAIEFERAVADSTTARLEWNNLVAIVERGQPARYFR